ncbi:helix-turn-helix domain-containing protein [Isoptericola cucumis]|uniref:TetR/AcrR family transcriptional regulator n=1 Tax=Isoptericola cucumis TaxID=1776856 RepID=UPI00320AA84F
MSAETSHPRVAGPAAATTPADPPLRSDARQNRDRIVEAARWLFASRGIDVPLAAVARRADVGVATLYRRFPTRESLVEAAFAEEFATCAAAVDQAAADPDPWRGFRVAVEHVCALQAVDRGFSAAFLAALPETDTVARERDRVLGVIADLVARAQAVGRLRPDVTMDDLALVVMANSGVVAESPEEAQIASRRLVGILLSGFRADGAVRLPPATGRGLVESLRRRESPPPRAPRRPSSR